MHYHARRRFISLISPLISCIKQSPTVVPFRSLWGLGWPSPGSFPLSHPTGSVGYAPTVYNVPVLSVYNPNAEYGSSRTWLMSTTTPISFSARRTTRIRASPLPRWNIWVCNALFLPGALKFVVSGTPASGYFSTHAPVGRRVRRWKTKKEVPKDYLALELLVPLILLLPSKREPEMTHTR